MVTKRIAAALTGLCLAWGTAFAGPSITDAPQAAVPGNVPEGVGATGNDVIVLEIGPAADGSTMSPDEVQAMQLLLLQLLMMQSEGGGAPEMPMGAPASTGTGI